MLRALSARSRYIETSEHDKWLDRWPKNRMTCIYGLGVSHHFSYRATRRKGRGKRHDSSVGFFILCWWISQGEDPAAVCIP
jgi:hypothetical protein